MWQPVIPGLFHVSQFAPLHCARSEEYEGTTTGSESTVKQIGRPVDSAATVYEWEGLQARQPGQNKMLRRTMFVPMVELIIFLFYPVYFQALLLLYPRQTVDVLGESDLKYLHRKDKMILSSRFHSLCRVQKQWMTERLGWGRLKSSTLWTAEQMHGRTDTSSMSAPKIVKHSWVTQATPIQQLDNVCDGWKLLECTFIRWVWIG